MREFVAVIHYDPEHPNNLAQAKSRYSLKLINKHGIVVYEKALNKMLDSWYLAKDVFIYQEDASSNIITYVYKLNEYQYKHFKLPDDLNMSKPKANGMEALVQEHAYKDKETLRTYIRE